MNTNSVMSMIPSTTTKVENEKSTQLPCNHNSTIMFHKSFLFKFFTAQRKQYALQIVLRKNEKCKQNTMIYSLSSSYRNSFRSMISSSWTENASQHRRMPEQYSRCYANCMQYFKILLHLLRQQ